MERGGSRVATVRCGQTFAPKMFARSGPKRALSKPTLNLIAPIIGVLTILKDKGVIVESTEVKCYSDDSALGIYAIPGGASIVDGKVWVGQFVEASLIQQKAVFAVGELGRGAADIVHAKYHIAVINPLRVGVDGSEAFRHRTLLEPRPLGRKTVFGECGILRIGSSVTDIGTTLLPGRLLLRSFFTSLFLFWHV
jgi:hypothetical protein